MALRRDDGPVIPHDVKRRPTRVVLPAAEWQRLRKQAKGVEVEELLEQHAILHVQAMRIGERGNPLKVLREWRALSQAQLAEWSGVPQPTVAALKRVNAGRKVTQVVTAWRSKGGPPPAHAALGWGGVKGGVTVYRRGGEKVCQLAEA